MNHIPKCSSKFSIHHQAKDIKPSQKEFAKENLAQKISKKMLKFSASRYFGKDITNNSKSNIHSIYNNHCTKIVTIVDKKQNASNIYIKKHSSASQVVQKPQKIKNNLDERKIRENKTNFLINKKEYPPPSSSQGGNKLHSSISFGVNYNIRPASTSNNNKSISVRISNPKNYSNNNSNKFNASINNRSINSNNNNASGHNYNFSYTNNINKIVNNNIKNENMNKTHNALDIM